MLSRRAIKSLIVAVVFVGSCRCDGFWDFLVDPLNNISTAKTTNVPRFPLMNPRFKIANSDDEFEMLFKAPGKKMVLIIFKRDFSKNTGSFDDEFLKKIAREYRDADVIKVNVDQCPKTADKYKIPETSDKVHFGVNFRLSADDYLNPRTTDIVQDLLNKSDPSKKKLTRKQKVGIIDSLTAEQGEDKSDERSPSKVLDKILPTMRPTGTTCVEKDALGKPVKNIKDVQIFQTNPEKILLGTESQGTAQGNTENGVTRVTADSDGEFVEALSKAEDGLVVIHVTNNSLDIGDRGVKTFLRNVAVPAESKMKIIQVNTDKGKSNGTIVKYGITSYPLLLFVKYGKMQAARLAGYDVKAMQAEMSNLFTRSVVAYSDAELNDVLSNWKNELIVLFVTNNSLDDCDCEMKEYHSNVTNRVDGIKIIQVNANTGKFLKAVMGLEIVSYPSVLFVKRGKLQAARVNGCANVVAIKSEISNLFARSVVVDSDAELRNALSNADNESIAVFFTGNTLNDCDREMKEYLRTESNTTRVVKLIQVNTNTGKCPKAMDQFGVAADPTVLFLKRGVLQSARVTSCRDLNAIDVEIDNLFTRTVAVDSDDELEIAFSDKKYRLIVVHVTDNSLSADDCDAKKFLGRFSVKTPDIEFIQVNANTGKCGGIIDHFHVESYPVILFAKHGKWQSARVTRATGFDRKTINAELYNLLSNSAVVDGDEELADAMSNAENELIVLHVTDNSLDDGDCDVKEFLCRFSFSVTDIRIIQVNANTGKCARTIAKYNIASYPSLLFVKHGKVQQSRVTGFDSEAIQAELNVLKSNSELLVDSDEELDNALGPNANDELIVVFFTDNSLSVDDRKVKSFLNTVTNGVIGLKIIQVNVNTGKCENSIAKYNVTSYPLLLFKKHGKMQAARVTGFNDEATPAEISNLLTSSKVVDSDAEFDHAMTNANDELIVVFFTDNSLDRCDCETKVHLRNVSNTEHGIHIIQVNVNTGQCTKTTAKYNVTSYPSILFVKFGRLQQARVTVFYEKAIDAEVRNLLSRSVVVDSQDELDGALSNEKNELIIMFFTNNSLDKRDCAMKEFLGIVSATASDIKIVQVNADSHGFRRTIDPNFIETCPVLIFSKHGQRQENVIFDYNPSAITDGIDKLRETVHSTSVVTGTKEVEKPPVTTST